jgi:hypothetical protein
MEGPTLIVRSPKPFTGPKPLKISMPMNPGVLVNNWRNYPCALWGLYIGKHAGRETAKRQQGRITALPSPL